MWKSQLEAQGGLLPPLSSVLVWIVFAIPLSLSTCSVCLVDLELFGGDLPLFLPTANFELLSMRMKLCTYHSICFKSQEALELSSWLRQCARSRKRTQVLQFYLQNARDQDLQKGPRL